MLQKIKREMNIDMNKSMITDWEYPIANSNIKVEIEKAEKEARQLWCQLVSNEGSRSTFLWLTSHFSRLSW